MHSRIVFLSPQLYTQTKPNQTKPNQMKTSIETHKGQYFVTASFSEGHITTHLENSLSFSDYKDAELFEAKLYRFAPTVDQLANSDMWGVTSVSESYELQAALHATGVLDMDR